MRRKLSRNPFQKKRTPLSEVGGFRSAMVFVFMVSGVVSVLALTGSFYMLQIYDRALTSQSVPTLLALSVLAIGLYLIQGMLDVTRGQILARIGGRIDQALAPLAHKVAIDMPRFGFSIAESNERSRDVDTLRNFFGGQGPIALFDMPWLPLYLAFVYLLHPWLGLLTLGGAVALAVIALLTEFVTQRHVAATQQAAVARATLAESNARNADVIRAMGFAGQALARFERLNMEHLKQQARATSIAGMFSGSSKVLRMILQSAVLGLGAYLTIIGELTAGSIIAASVASARALAPVDLAISQWRNVVSARRSYGRLAETLKALDDAKPSVQLPAPARELRVEKITVAAPSSGSVVLNDVSLQLNAGQAMGVIGPSGGGKTTLVRALTGVWPLLRGEVRLDGADLDQWSPEVLGRNVGYLPQDVSLLDATVGENIARLDPNADSANILAAAKAAGVHDLIVRLPQGYETPLGPHGAALSSGQRQRIGLARALYGDPFLVILDEPNSNLDADGDAALTDALLGIRARKGIAVIVAHRPSALAAVDMVAVIQQGKLAAFGAKDEILARETKAKVVPVKPVRAPVA